MQGAFSGVIAKPYSCPLLDFRSPSSGRVHARVNFAPTISFPLKASSLRISKKDPLMHVPAISASLMKYPCKYDFLHTPQHSHEKINHHLTKASKDKFFNLEPYPRMTGKPVWWWRTLACLPYLMTFYDHQYWKYAHPTHNPPPFLEKFDSLTFPLLLAIFALPRVLLSCYAFLCWMSIVRQNYWPHFFRFHVITAILIGSVIEVIGISSGWFPSWFFPPHFWSFATFVYLVTVLQCITCALGGSYPNVPFVNDAAYLHADLRL